MSGKVNSSNVDNLINELNLGEKAKITKLPDCNERIKKILKGIATEVNKAATDEISHRQWENIMSPIEHRMRRYGIRESEIKNLIRWDSGSNTNSSEGGARKTTKKTKTKISKTSKKATYTKTEAKHKDSKGKECTIYKKGDKKYVKKLSKSTGKFTYRAI